jgi:uncharacterized membrane protein YkoI
MKNTKRNMIVSIAPILLAFSIGATSLSLATSVAGAQMYKSSSSMMSGAGQNQSKMMMGTSGPNITGTIQLGPIIAKAIASQVNVSLANASTTAEKSVGPSAHAVALRIGVVHGFLVYMALVVDSNNNFHGVLVDAGNGKVLAPTQMSMAAMMQSGMGMMGPSMGMMGPQLTFQPGMMNGPGMMGPSMAIPIQPGMMNGPGIGMMQPGMMGPGMMMGHP